MVTKEEWDEIDKRLQAHEDYLARKNLGPWARRKIVSVIYCAVPKGTMAREFDPFPASEKAIKQGCTCPHQTEWPKHIAFDSDCPVHDLEIIRH